MKILFYSTYQPVPNHGGVERVTSVVAEGLSSTYHHECFSLFKCAVDENHQGSFAGSYMLPQDNQEKFIQQLLANKNIQIVIIQGAAEADKLFCNICRQLSVPLVYVMHSDPGYGYDTFTLSNLLYEITWASGKLLLHKLFMLANYPLYRLRSKRNLVWRLKRIEENCDLMVLLSKASIKKLKSLTNCKRDIYSISNPLSYPFFATPEEINRKEKRVLIVCRMEEYTKKITLALRIWKELSDRHDISDWNLDIVGDGKDLEHYKYYVEKQNIHNVTFFGHQDPLPFYRRSSIFMMTSCCEGWGQTLTESMQMGCVPIAFYSYCAVHDIIDDGQTGYLVKPNSIEIYVEKLSDLINNSEIRQSMSIQGIEKSKLFDRENIIKQWHNLLSQTNI